MLNTLVLPKGTMGKEDVVGSFLVVTQLNQGIKIIQFEDVHTVKIQILGIYTYLRVYSTCTVGFFAHNASANIHV